jgi:hypothetical protein
MESSAIPAAGEINVSDAPKISPVEFLRQIIENIQSQISSIDEEFLQACQTDNPEVRF